MDESQEILEGLKNQRNATVSTCRWCYSAMVNLAFQSLKDLRFRKGCHYLSVNIVSDKSLDIF